MSAIIPNWRFWCSNFFLGSVLIACLQERVFAQIIPDDSLINNSNVTRDGKTFNINGGTQAGSNLFHSFEEFSVPTNGIASFDNAVDIQNIITRVTGGSASDIDGLIKANGTANLFLINPSGIVFGENARLDIGGSFVGSTANSINFAGGIEFNANTPQAKPLLSIDVPLGLQYGTNSSSIINRSQWKNSSGETVGLEVKPGKTLALVGGDVELDGGKLQAPGGRVELGGVAEAETLGLQVNGNNLRLGFPDYLARANVFLTKGSEVDVTAGGGGDIVVNAQNLDILGGSKLLAGIGKDLGTVGERAGDISLNATGAIEIGQSSKIFPIPNRIENNVNRNATGDGGDINIQARSLNMSDGAWLSAMTAGQGNSGSIFIQVADEVLLSNQSYIDSSTRLITKGNAGNIKIGAGSLTMKEAWLSASALHSGTGQGNGGNISVQVEGAVELEDSSINSIVGSLTVGNGGDIQVEARSLIMTDEAIVNTGTYGQGNAGNITVQVEDEVSLTTSYINSFVSSQGKNFRAVGEGGNIQIKAGSLVMNADPRLKTRTGGGISTSTLGTGNAGNISIQIEDQLSLSDYSYITTGVNNTAKGDGGDIQIEARSVSMTDGPGLTTKTDGSGDAGNIFVQVENEVFLKNSFIDSKVDLLAVGNGGNIQVEAGWLIMTEGAQLRSSTVGQGVAGNIEIDAADFVSISGFDPAKKLPFSGLFTNTEERAIGQGGDILVTTDTLHISNRARLDAKTKNGFRGGNITVNANTFETLSGGQLVTTTLGSGNAGNIFVKADLMTLSGSDPNYTARIAKFPKPISPLVANKVTETASYSGLFANTSENSTGKGGDLNVKTGQLTVQDGAQVSVSSAGSGDAGSLRVNANSINLDTKGKLTGTTASGRGGDIRLDVEDLILMRNNSAIATTAANNGSGGNITINAPDGFVIASPLENSDILANAEAGNGGNIDINATGIYGLEDRTKFPEPNSNRSEINASSEFGTDGTVELITPDTDPNSGLIELPTIPVDTEVAQSCYSPGYAQSSFVITGRGGLPPNPKDILTPDTAQIDWVSVKPSKSDRSLPPVTTKATISTPKRIVEATSATLNAKGQVVLAANPSTVTSDNTSRNNPIKCHGS